MAKEYIEREAALHIVRRYCHPANVESEIAKLPAADVRPVIRCRDCKKFGTVFCALDVNRTDIIIKRATENDYCSKAEQK